MNCDRKTYSDSPNAKITTPITKRTRRINVLLSITGLSFTHKITWIAGKERGRYNSKVAVGTRKYAAWDALIGCFLHARPAPLDIR